MTWQSKTQAWAKRAGSARKLATLITEPGATPVPERTVQAWAAGERKTPEWLKEILTERIEAQLKERGL